MLYSVRCDSLEIISLTCALNHSHAATTTQGIDSRRAWLLAFSLISTPNMHSCSSWPLWVLFGDPFDHLPFLDAEQEVFVNTSEPQPRLGDFDGLCCPSACNLDDKLDDGLWETLDRSTPSIARPPLHGSLWIPHFCCWRGASACCSSSTAVGGDPTTWWPWWPLLLSCPPRRISLLLERPWWCHGWRLWDCRHTILVRLLGADFAMILYSTLDIWYIVDV